MDYINFKLQMIDSKIIISVHGHLDSKSKDRRFLDNYICTEIRHYYHSANWPLSWGVVTPQEKMDLLKADWHDQFTNKQK